MPYLDPRDHRVDLRLLPDQTGLAHLAMWRNRKLKQQKHYITHRQAVEEVHQDDDDEEHKGKEEEVAEGRVEGNIGELELADKHGESLDKAEAEVVKESVVPVRPAVVLVKQDVEAEPKGEEEEGVPDEEGGEGLENSVEHGGVNIVGRKARVSTDHGDQLDPAEGKVNDKKYGKSKLLTRI